MDLEPKASCRAEEASGGGKDNEDEGRDCRSQESQRGNDDATTYRDAASQTVAKRLPGFLAISSSSSHCNTSNSAATLPLSEQRQQQPSALAAAAAEEEAPSELTNVLDDTASVPSSSSSIDDLVDGPNSAMRQGGAAKKIQRAWRDRLGTRGATANGKNEEDYPCGDSESEALNRHRAQDSKRGNDGQRSSLKQEQEQEEARRLMRRKEEIDRRLHPKSASDFQVLRAELALWHGAERERIDECCYFEAGSAPDEEDAVAEAEAEEDKENLAQLRRRRANADLLSRETALLRKIGTLRTNAAESRRDRMTRLRLAALSEPKRWRLGRTEGGEADDGGQNGGGDDTAGGSLCDNDDAAPGPSIERVVDVHTPCTIRARCLVSLYEKLTARKKGGKDDMHGHQMVDSRLNDLLEAKRAAQQSSAVAAYSSLSSQGITDGEGKLRSTGATSTTSHISALARDVCNLIDREADLLHRGFRGDAPVVSGLRMRLGNLFLQLVEASLSDEEKRWSSGEQGPSDGWWSSQRSAPWQDESDAAQHGSLSGEWSGCSWLGTEEESPLWLQSWLLGSVVP